MWSSFRFIELVAPTSSIMLFRLQTSQDKWKRITRLRDKYLCAEGRIQLLNYTKYFFSVWDIKFWIAFERLNVQIDNGQTIYENRTLTHHLCSNQFKKPDCIFEAISFETGRGQWLPVSLIFAPASNLGPARESQILLPKPLRISHF